MTFTGSSRVHVKKKGQTYPDVTSPDPTFVLISSDIKGVERIKKQISKIPVVSDLTEVAGMYDLIIRIESNSPSEIKDIIANKIRSIDDVRSCMSLFGIEPGPKRGGS